MKFSLAGLWRAGPLPLAGVDIGRSHLRWFELGGPSPGRAHLRAWAQEALPAGVMGHGAKIHDAPALALALQGLAAKAQSATRRLALALPSSAVIARRLTVLGAASDALLRTQIEAQAAQYIPHALDEVVLDWCELGPGDRPGEKALWVCATKKELVEDFQIALEMAGMEPALLTDEGQAIAQLLQLPRLAVAPSAPEDPKVYWHACLSGENSLHVVQNGRVMHHASWRLPTGLLQSMASRYGCSVLDAQVMLNSRPLGFAEQVLQPFVAQLAADLKAELQGMQERERMVVCEPICESIYLGGSAASLTGLQDLLQQTSVGRVVLLHPLEALGLEPACRGQALSAQDAPCSEPHSWVWAAGLAASRWEWGQ